MSPPTYPVSARYTYGQVGSDEIASVAKADANPKVVTVSDAERLVAITSIKALYVEACERGVLTSILKLPALETLEIAPIELVELDEFSGANALVDLKISGLSISRKRKQELVDLRPLAAAPSLKSISAYHFPQASEVLLPINAQLASLDLAVVPTSTIKQVTLMPYLQKLRIHNEELPAGELLLDDFSSLIELTLHIESPIRMRLPRSLKKLTLSDSSNVKIANPEVLTELAYFVAYRLKRFDGASILLSMPTLRYANIDKETRAAIGPIPDKWAATMTS